MANTIIPDLQTSGDMSATTSLAWSVLLGGILSGWYLYDLYLKQRSLEEKVEDVSGHTTHVDAVQAAQAEILCEHDQRLREKQDYDATLEVQEGLYQAWKGVASSQGLSLQVVLWREKLSTLGKNSDWAAWSGEKDGSTIVRDFYLGNLHPDFHWSITTQEGCSIGTVDETMVNGWDSVVRLCVQLTTEESAEESSVWNARLRELLLSDSIVWSRCLIAQTDTLTIRDLFSSTEIVG